MPIDPPVPLLRGVLTLHASANRINLLSDLFFRNRPQAGSTDLTQVAKDAMLVALCLLTILFMAG
jgi:hypothetical protein